MSVAQAQETDHWEVHSILDIAPVWSGHRVGFCLLTVPEADRQYAAYYDAERRMTVAWRSLDSDQWEYKVLPSRVGWDSHNYITMTVDSDGCLHLSGNMHCEPLVYFRTKKPHDPATFEAVHRMVGREEQRVTYPNFLRGADGELIFRYREGSSGQGNEFYNIYDPKTRTWSRLLDQPLTDGQGKRNAYFQGPKKGPDGKFHVAWMWRDTPDCRTNHTVSYARSPDLRRWETADGKPLALPILFGTPSVVVDPVPSFEGLINMRFQLGFDVDKRPIVTYHKYDSDGNSQIFNARSEKGQWKIYQVSQWDYRWEFEGGGSIPCEISGGAVRAGKDGLLFQEFSHRRFGGGVWKLDPKTMKIVDQTKKPVSYPQSLNRPQSDFPGMQVNRSDDLGNAPCGFRYALRWETLGNHRDRPRKGDLPDPSQLQLITLRNKKADTTTQPAPQSE